MTYARNVRIVCATVPFSDGAPILGSRLRQVEEGLNAGCGQVIGVLSGADSREALLEAGAHTICENITKLPLP